MFKALSSRNFRLFYFSQGISFTGNLIQEIALSWLIYKLTGEAFYVGLLFFMKQIAAFFLSPLAGVLSDKISMRAILISTNVLMMMMASAMGLVVLANYNVVFWILTLQCINGLVSGIDVPVRQAFVKELVSDGSLINAIALNSSLFNVARISSPLLAGILIPLIGEAACILINAVSFLTVIGGILLMKDLRVNERKGHINVIRDIKDGLSYTFSNNSLREVMVVTAGISLFGFPYTVLLPVFVKEVLQGDVRELGFLTTAIGVGSLLSGLYLASRKSTAGLQVLICLACVIYGLGLIVFSGVVTLPLAMFALVLVGVSQVLVFSSCNSILQTLSDTRMTGRVLSLFIMTYMGATTIGSLTVGFLADYIGATSSLIICGIGCLATAFYLFLTVKSIKRRMSVRLRIKKGVRKYAIKEILP